MKTYEGLTKPQFDALCEIAFGGDGNLRHPKTLRALLSKGLIKESEKTLFGRGNTPIDRMPMIVKIYSMPIAEHIKFCQWCADNCED